MRTPSCLRLRKQPWRIPETGPCLPLQTVPKGLSQEADQQGDRQPARLPRPRVPSPPSKTVGQWPGRRDKAQVPSPPPAVPLRQGGLRGHRQPFLCRTASHLSGSQAAARGQRGRKELSAGDNLGSLGGHRAQKGSCPHPRATLPSHQPTLVLTAQKPGGLGFVGCARFSSYSVPWWGLCDSASPLQMGN